MLKAAATIASVEARHAAWISDIVGQSAAPDGTRRGRPGRLAANGGDSLRFGVVGAVEGAHVVAFRKQLRRKAVKQPAFDVRGTTEDQQAFLKTAVAFEDLAVAPYKGQAHLIESDAMLAAAVSIHSVEARHAAWMRHLFGIRPVARACDEGKSKAEIQRIVQSTSFVVARPRTQGRGGPRFTG